MTTRPPAEVGMPLEAVDTPAVLLDLDAFEKNIARLTGAVSGTSNRLRPPAKSHRCPVIALRQMASGAVGGLLPKGERGRGYGPRRRP